MTQIDTLILDCIDHGRQASSEELALIVAHVTQAPFASYQTKVPTQLRQLLTGKGFQLPAKLSSLEIHWLKRVNEEEQWSKETTPPQYVADLQQAVRHPDVQLWFYRYYGHPFAGFLSPSHVRGAKGIEAYIFVAYSPIHGTITTGYQASSIHTIFTDGYTDLKQQR
jgi:hypothetical protein